MDISIILPIYNVEQYLDKCINSVLNQQFDGEYEIICINDGSTDRSLEILNTFKNSENVIIINQKNQGLSYARNIGLKNARGKYVMFLDSDDYLKHNSVLTILFNEMEKYELDFVIADFEYDYKDKSMNQVIKRHDILKNRVFKGEEFYNLGIKYKSIMSVVWNKLYAREFLIKNNLFFLEGVLYEDMEFTPKVFYSANRVKYIEEVIIMYTQRTGSIMNKKVVRYEDYFRIADSLSNFNKNINSKTILNAELYMYILLIRNLMKEKDKNVKVVNQKKMNDRKVKSKFLSSNNFKYKLIGILCSLNIL